MIRKTRQLITLSLLRQRAFYSVTICLSVVVYHLSLSWPRRSRKGVLRLKLSVRGRVRLLHLANLRTVLFNIPLREKPLALTGTCNLATLSHLLDSKLGAMEDCIIKGVTDWILKNPNTLAESARSLDTDGAAEKQATVPPPPASSLNGLNASQPAVDAQNVLDPDIVDNSIMEILLCYTSNPTKVTGSRTEVLPRSLSNIRDPFAEHVRFTVSVGVVVAAAAEGTAAATEGTAAATEGTADGSTENRLAGDTVSQESHDLVSDGSDEVAHGANNSGDSDNGKSPGSTAD
ncbi:uncharacterized protein LOC111829241 [Capsella rubella]|uniref:uncharacterized protein LOC111829241 n=1 Tax=Capsella rubella TaxID=81985 RepID=UPI000CD4C872|nr:uncharacterized protein LOC111829241 [Capsella rubella]XP_023633685.1 uncharacterized protein LOC111829241 [Capsella rubella]XP_023633690.1 uncharacterized protein LOC111829241 [Capsella rubella]